MRFVSLASLMPPEARSGSQIDRIARANDGVVFLYGGAVLHWNYHDIAVIARYSRDDPPWSVSIVDGQAWIGTPHIGIGSSCCLFRAVRAMFSALDATIASSWNSS